MFVQCVATLVALTSATGQFMMRSGTDGAASGAVLGRDLSIAMDEILGCGNQRVTAEHLEQIKSDIRSMWETMPNNDGRLDWKSLRYIAHRYFMKQSSLLIRGLEPSRSLNSTEMGLAEILAKAVPQHAELLFGRKLSDYSIDDAAAFLAALEQLVFDSETHLLERVYGQFGMETTRWLSSKQTQRLLEAYIVNWMMSEDERAVRILLRNKTLLANSLPRWNDIKEFIEGRIQLMDFQDSQSLRPGVGVSLMEKKYSFAHVHRVIGGVTKTFQDFWQSECHTMKDQLVAMDRDGIGRVRLSDFYGTGLEKDWRFGESESYLRDLGVLDESSPWKGKQVIIPNYLQAASNCIVATPHYLVCCKNECEEMLDEIESSVRKPTASVEDLIDVVRNMSSPSNPLDEPPILEGALMEQLQKVAESHGGQVPLHGRLFAQWMHYAFPRECSFPHKIGTFAQHTLTPGAFGGGYIASKDEMQEHVSSSSDEISETNDENWMSQWSEEEELFADYTGKMRAPWERSGGFACGLVVIAAIAMIAFGVVARGHGNEKPGNAIPAFSSTHSHFV